MKTLLVNDTSNYHSGCKQVVAALNDQFEIAHSLVTAVPHMQFNQWDNIDLVVINGEGTMHNNRPGAVSILNFAQQAINNHKPVALINSIWQNMDTKWQSVTNRLCYWSVRDILSQQYAEQYFDRKPAIHADFSLCYKVDLTTHAPVRILCGQTWNKQPCNFAQQVNIFNDDWNTVCSKIACSDLLISQRYHEILAAIKVRKPFVAITGNSWKMQALIDTADSLLPVLDQWPDSLSEVEHFPELYHSEYQKIFNWYHNNTCSKISNEIY